MKMTVMISGCLRGTLNQSVFPPLWVLILSFVMCHIQNFTATIKKKEELKKNSSSDFLWGKLKMS